MNKIFNFNHQKDIQMILGEASAIKPDSSNNSNALNNLIALRIANMNIAINTYHVTSVSQDTYLYQIFYWIE